MDFNKIYINGEWVYPNSKMFLHIENPANKQIIGKVPRCNTNDVNNAVTAGKKAFETWQFESLDNRINYMKNFKDILISKMDIMENVIVKELGCSYFMAKNVHLQLYIDEIDHFIQVAKDYCYEKKLSQYIIRKEPVGVVAAITPWNFPFGQITKKIVPALLAGNTVILKPSQITPLIAYHLTDAIDKAGFPPGTFNLVPGAGSEVGNILAEHKDIDMVSFTGSTTGGIEVSTKAIDNIKNITLELGGKSPSLILPTADLDKAISSTMKNIYMNTGQSCSALSRMIAPIEFKKSIESKIIEFTNSVKFGNPEDEGTMYGPLASKKQFDKVKNLIQTGLDEGAKLLLGQVPDDDSNGYYVGPVVFTDVNSNMRIYREEIFGPVLTISYYDNINEGIEMANDTVYGLSAAVFGEKNQALDVAGDIRAGEVKVNSSGGPMEAPFGGYKQSGIGREGGIFGYEEYLETKAIF